MSNWKDIGSAPRDGTKLLLWHKELGVVSGWRHDHYDAWLTNYKNCYFEFSHITHWQPLPEPPSEDE